MKAITWSSTAALVALALVGMHAAHAQSPEAADQIPGRDPVDAPSAGGPVRLARVAFIEGDVTWRPDDASAWSPAAINMPLQQGAEVWVKGDGRAEVQFDDGSDIRLGREAVATLQSLYSDSQGEFTEIKLNDGTSSVHLKDKYSIYQIDTPFESVKASGPARFRVDVGADVSVGVRTGSATITTGAGDTQLRSGDFAVVHGADDTPQVEGLPQPDAWDSFDDEREGILVGGTEHLPANIAIVAGGIDRFGRWRHEGAYGWVWCPTVGASWRPYHDGHWVWVNPFGWTWVSDEEWGWAPYHYGSWAHFSYGWGWCPGPYHQYWSPAVVDFTSYNGDFCWTPLCPEEIVYPGAFGIGFGGGDWWLNFSIGGCGVYRPFGDGRCHSERFGRGDFFGLGGFNGFREHNFATSNGHFVPRNAAFGASVVSQEGFGRSSQFRTVHGNATRNFQRGSNVMAAGHAFSGPVTATPSRASLTPSHTFTSSGRPSTLNRTLFRAPVSSNVARSSAPFGRSVTPGGRLGPVSRPARTGSGAGLTTIERARQSLGFVGRNGVSSSASHASDRSSRPTVGGNTGFERTTPGSRPSSATNSRTQSGTSTVDRARQSLGYSGRGSDTTTRGSSRSGSSSSGSSGSSGRGSDSTTRGSSTGRGTSRSSSGSGSSSYGGRGSDTTTRGSSSGRTSGGSSSSGSSGYGGRGRDTTVRSSSSVPSGSGASSSGYSGFSGRGSDTRGSSTGRGSSGSSGSGSSAYSGRGSSSSGSSGYSGRGSSSSGSSAYSGRGSSSSGSSAYSGRGSSSSGSSGYSGRGASSSGSSGYSGRGSSSSGSSAYSGRGSSGSGSSGYSGRGSSSSGSSGYSGRGSSSSGSSAYSGRGSSSSGSSGYSGRGSSSSGSSGNSGRGASSSGGSSGGASRGNNDRSSSSSGSSRDRNNGGR